MEYAGKREQRHSAIRTMLLAKEIVTVAEFCEALHCSEATIRSDLSYLEEQGLCKRMFGGAVSTGNTAFNAGMSARFSAFIKEKDAIAAYIVEHILQPGQSIALDAGSTNVQLAAKIVEAAIPLTVVTNSLAAAALLVKSHRIRIYLTGGIFDAATSSFHDGTARAAADTVTTDLFFFSPNGFSVTAGFTVPGPEEALLKQILISRTKTVIAIGEHPKFDRIAFKIVCGLDQVSRIITDEGVGERHVREFAEAGTPVIKAPLLNR